MRGEVSVLSVSKRDNTADENNDACWPDRDRSLDAPALRLSMADGVSESSLSGPWARSLVRAYGVTAPRRALTDAAEFAEVLGPLAAAWPRDLASYVAREQRHRELQYWERGSLRRGAAATVLAVALYEGGRYTAAALGDTCLFRVDRELRLREAFPLTTPNAFTSTPATAASVDPDPQRVRDQVRLYQGQWRPGDRFFLATDALSAWLLHGQRSTVPPWPELDDAVTKSGGDSRRFGRWVTKLRDSRGLKDDDVSVLRLALP